jgi:hypothetical protein
MPVGDPKPFGRLVGALGGNLDANHGIAGIHDGADDTLDRVGQGGHAVPDRASEMALDGDTAYLGEALVDLQIAAIGREASQPDRCRIVDKLQGGQLRKQHDGR